MLLDVSLGSLFFAWCTLMAMVPIRRPRPLAVQAFMSASVVNELPFLFAFIVVVSTAPDLFDGDHLTNHDLISAVLGAFTLAGLAVLAFRSTRTGAAVDAALDETLGTAWRTEPTDAPRRSTGRQLRWARILFIPWPIRPRSIERIRNIAYGDRGTTNRLDVYRHRSHPADTPTMIHFHGGYFRWGRKSLYAPRCCTGSLATGGPASARTTT